MRFLVMPAGFLLMTSGFGAVVMLLWNWLMPAIFGLISISFWQALGLFALCRILLGSFGGGHHHGRMRKGGMHGVNHIRDKWMKMTPEQRKEFISRRKEHFGRGHFFADEDLGFNDDENTPKDNE